MSDSDQPKRTRLKKVGGSVASMLVKGAAYAFFKWALEQLIG